MSQRILQYPETWLPGESIPVVGDFSATATARLQALDGTVIPLTVAVDVNGAAMQDTGWARFLAPASLAWDLYALIVTDAAGDTDPVLLNQAKLKCVDSTDIVGGVTLELLGKNLIIPNAYPTARLLDTGNGSAIPLRVDMTTNIRFRQHLTIAPGALTLGRQYKLAYSNGRGAEVLLDGVLTCVPDYGNPYGIPVAWAHAFPKYDNIYDTTADSRLSAKVVADGVTDDRAAVQAAVNLANQQGGGVVQLPAGTLKFLKDGYGGIEFHSNVLVVGTTQNGVNQTTIKYGYAADPNKGNLFTTFYNTDFYGAVNVNFENIDSKWISTSGFGSSAGVDFDFVHAASTRAIFHNVGLKLGAAEAFHPVGVSKLCISGCHITQANTPTNYESGPVDIFRCQDVVYRDNVGSFATQGVSMSFCRRVVDFNNGIRRDPNFSFPLGTTNHQVSYSFCERLHQEAANLSMLPLAAGNVRQDSNDGETVIVEDSAGNPDGSVGYVTSATSNTLTDSSANWNALNPLYQGWTGVAIVAGKGAPQWLPIASRSGTTTTLDGSWKVLPDNTSRYAVLAWGLRDSTICSPNGPWSGNQRGITLYLAGIWNVDVHNLVLVNNGSIDLTPAQYTLDGVNTRDFRPNWQTRISNCNVSQPDNVMGCHIGVHAVQHVQKDPFGVLSLLMQVTDCQLTAPLQRPTRYAKIDALVPSGLSAFCQFEPNGPLYVPNPAIPSVLLPSFENCVVNNCDTPLNANVGTRGLYTSNVAFFNCGAPNLNAYTTGTTAIGPLVSYKFQPGLGLFNFGFVLPAASSGTSPAPSAPAAPTGASYNAATQTVDRPLTAGQTAALFEYALLPS